MRLLISTVEDIARAARYVQGLKPNGKRSWVFEVKTYRRPRTNAQNASYWATLGMISSETGQDKDDLHEWCKRRFLPARMVTVGGQTMRIAGSTRTLDAGEFTKYLDSVYVWAADFLGVICPKPGDLGYDQMMVQHGEQKR
jgi:hypothetical protein